MRKNKKDSDIIRSSTSTSYYLAGPFWDDSCKKFFDEFKENCEKSIMINSIDSDSAEMPVISHDFVFMPGSFSVNFPEIKKSFDISSFKRVINQVLALDTNMIDRTDKMVVYVPGYDLGTMFELGYKMADYLGYTEEGAIRAVSMMKENIIFHQIDDTLIKCISDVIRYSNEIISSVGSNTDGTSDESGIDNLECMIEEYLDDYTIMKVYNYNPVVINMDSCKSNPFWSILAGVLYRFKIPFITYSINNTKSNTMILGTSLCHIKAGSYQELLEKLRSIESDHFSMVWSDDNINYAREIK